MRCSAECRGVQCIEYSEQFRGNTAELRERKSLHYEIPITKRHPRKHPIAYPIGDGRGSFTCPGVITTCKEETAVLQFPL
jgi:hypothetical protein